MSTGCPVRADSTTASTTSNVLSPSLPEQIGATSPRMTAAKCSIWLANGSVRSTSATDEVNGSHHDLVPWYTFSRIVGTDSDPFVPTMW